MGSIFLFLFFAWLFKGFGKAITHTDKKHRTSWDSLSYEQKAFMTKPTDDETLSSQLRK